MRASLRAGADTPRVLFPESARSRVPAALGALAWFARRRPLGAVGALLVLVLVALALVPELAGP